MGSNILLSKENLTFIIKHFFALALVFFFGLIIKNKILIPYDSLIEKLFFLIFSGITLCTVYLLISLKLLKIYEVSFFVKKIYNALRF